MILSGMLLLSQLYPCKMNTKTTLIGLGVLAIGAFAGLFYKNSLSEKAVKTLTQAELVRILRLLRKEKYIIYKQIATFAMNIASQTQNNINPQLIEGFINGPESPIKIPEEMQKIKERVCNSQNSTVEAFDKAIEIYENQEEIIALIRLQEQDYQISLKGRMPVFKVNIPESLTKEKFITIQNQITKKTYVQQVAVFKKLAEYSEQELQQNPQLMADLSNNEQQQEEILLEEGLGSEFEPAFAVYEAATMKFHNDPTTRMKIGKIEEGYRRILMKYSMKIQSKTITLPELEELESEIVFYDPLSY